MEQKLNKAASPIEVSKAKSIMIDLTRNDHFYVITGGPGAGKTTLLNGLSENNRKVVPEVARELIKEQEANNGEALPWKNTGLYKKMMFDRSIKSFKDTENNWKHDHPVFFDRGFLDTLCYAKIIGAEIDDQMVEYALKWRYNDDVFMLPPWKEIYITDHERKQDWNEAKLTYQMMAETYEEYGYNIIEIPMKPVAERVRFVLNHLRKGKTA